MKPNVIFFLVLQFLLFFSCSNDGNSILKSDRRRALLGQWEYQSIITDRAVDLNGDNTSNINLFNTQELPQCVKDNITTFTDNGPSGKPEYNVTENNLACDGNNPFSFVEEDFWTLGNHNSTISFENRQPFRIIEMTRSSLTVESDDNFDGQDYIMTITYSKK